MEMKLVTQARDVAATNNSALRDADMIPAVYYGNDKVSTAITVPRQEFITLYKEAGQSTIINLTTPGGEEQAIVQDIHVHPLEDNIYVKDIALPPSAKLITGEEVIVATVSAIKEEVEEEVTEIDMDAIASDEKNDGKEEAPTEEES